MCSSLLLSHTHTHMEILVYSNSKDRKSEKVVVAPKFVEFKDGEGDRILDLNIVKSTLCMYVCIHACM